MYYMHTTTRISPHDVIMFAVARRCIPTFVDVVSQAESVFNFTSPSELEELANMTEAYSPTDLILSVNIESLVNGSL